MNKRDYIGLMTHHQPELRKPVEAWIACWSQERGNQPVSTQQPARGTDAASSERCDASLDDNDAALAT
ncbi:MAG TPA: hypothetical protein DEF43_01385 [Chloroflexus aurantiacus]|nr:MAG: hypothetical protein D6716_15190 [Chloroflexota bacterium]HBW65823.1 hypothetical protein [Chloroflexus aurantiacus]